MSEGNTELLGPLLILIPYIVSTGQDRELVSGLTGPFDYTPTLAAGWERLNDDRMVCFECVSNGVVESRPDGSDDSREF
ncbi:hypothetical protein C470_07736 [Halorubrum distributum JCM 13561]|uniref:Uncharacterized protein n=1 Tax=Halorubrum distributum JCM 13561 TaxID=1227483 RepID=M0NUN1_9EURY|nr:hypothetical protein C470_07736 [Halorubrum litoreum JCM 13561]